MAGETLLISAAGLGDRLRFGSPKVVNARLSVTVSSGIAAPALVIPDTFIRSNTLGGDLHLDLNTKSEWGYRLDFTPTLRPITSISSGDQSAIGTVAIHNSAFNVIVDGIKTDPFGADTRVLNTYGLLQLDFGELKQEPLPLHFSWTPLRILTSVGGFDSAGFGKAEVDQYQSIQWEGLFATGFSDQHFIANDISGRQLQFDFIEPAASKMALSLAFDPNKRPVMTKGSDFSQIGPPVIKNASDAIYLNGIGDSSFGYPFTYSPKFGGRLVFDLVQVKNQSGINVAFSFYNSLRDITPVGFIATQFGNIVVVPPARKIYPFDIDSSFTSGKPWISNWVRYPVMTGVPSAAHVGAPQVFWGYPQTIPIKGIAHGSAGAPEVDQTIRRLEAIGIHAFGAGWASLVAYAIRSVHPEGIASRSAVGFHTVNKTIVTQPEDQTVFAGFYAALYGRATVENYFKAIYPDSLLPPRLATPHVEEWQFRRFVFPRGASSYLVPVPGIMQPYQLVGSRFLGDTSPDTGLGTQTYFGAAKLEAYRRYIYGAGFLSTVMSTRASVRDRAFYPETISASKGAVFGTLDLSHEVRSIRFAGFLSSGTASPVARLEKASIYVPFISGFLAGVPTVGEGTRILRIGGITPSEAVGGRLRIEYFARVVRTESWASARLGVYTGIKDARQWLHPYMISPPEYLLSGAVANRDRYIQPLPWLSTGVDGVLYGNAWVADRARHVLVASINQWRLGVGVTIYEFRGDIYDVHVPSSLVFGRSFISHEHRAVSPEGFDSSFISRFFMVRNAARAVVVKSMSSTALGYGAVANLNRYYRMTSIADLSLKAGVAFIAYAERSIAPVGMRASSYFSPDGWVSLWSRPVGPKGIFENTMSARWETEVVERFYKIAPVWNTQNRRDFGEASLVLRNKSMGPYGYDYSEFGQSTVDWWVRELPNVGAGNMTLFGRTLIRDKKQSVFLSGWRVSNVSLQLRVRNVQADPPWPRSIQVVGFYAGAIFGGVRMRDNVLFPGSVYRSNAGFGSVTLRHNLISVDSGIVNYLWGTAAVLGPRYINATSAEKGERMGLASFWPFVIYAPFGDAAPEKYTPARSGGEHVVDYYAGHPSSHTMDKNVGNIWVPRPRVDHYHRRLVVESMSPPWPNWYDVTAKVYNALQPRETRYIDVRGASHMRLGWVLFGPFTEVVNAEAFRPGGAVGKPKVEILVIPDINRSFTFTGVLSYVSGRPIVDYYNRFVQAYGGDASLYGKGIVWFAVRSVYPTGIGARLVIPTQAWVSNRKRYLTPPGLYAFNPETAFVLNSTRVENQYIGIVVAVKGQDISTVGVHVVARYQQYVKVSGIYPIPASRLCLKSRLTLSAQGFETMQFGNMRKFEEGVIQVHEAVSGTVSVPVVSTPRQVQGFASSVVDYPVIAAHIGPQGIESEDVGATVLKNEICCGDCG